MKSGRWQCRAASTTSAAVMLLAMLPAALPCRAAELLTLVLPGNANIQLRNRQTLSGVRLQELTRSAVNFVKGSRQSVPTASVAAITFEGRVVARQNLGSRVRGGLLKPCRTLPDLVLTSSGLTIQDNGSEASLNLQLLPADSRSRIQQAAPNRALVVTSLRFSPTGTVTMAYQDCPA